VEERVTTPPAPETPQPGRPKSHADAAYLRRYERIARIPIVLAAVVPLFIVPSTSGWLPATVGVVSWLVFVVDFWVHRQRVYRYLATHLGQFDLAVVILTAPWFLLPGAGEMKFTLVLRLARLARVLMVTGGGGIRRLFERLGRVAGIALAVLFLCSWLAYHNEHATNPGFATYGDALWWGIVTLTTVGYGDIVPNTTAGRWAGVMIMVTGIAVLGVLSGSLASFFRLDGSGGTDAAAGTDEEDEDERDEASTEEGRAPPLVTADSVSNEQLVHEVAELRRQIAVLTDLLTRREDQPP
jgi:voltage-gated potassium channel